MERSKRERKSRKSNDSRQLAWVLGVMVGILVFLLVFFLVGESLRKFEYGGFKFDKVKFGKLTFYHTAFSINNQITGSAIGSYNLFLRKDPRKIEVPVDAKISFDNAENNITYLSFDADWKCEDKGIALTELAKFLDAFGGNLKAGTTNINAATIDEPYVVCENTGKANIIVVKEGNESSIKQDKDNLYCYVLTVKDCNILDVTEKFIVETLIQARKSLR